LAQEIKGMVPRKHVDVGTEALNGRQHLPISPNLDKHFLDDFFGRFKRSGKSIKICAQPVVVGVKQPAKSYFVTLRSL